MARLYGPIERELPCAFVNSRDQPDSPCRTVQLARSSQQRGEQDDDADGGKRPREGARDRNAGRVERKIENPAGEIHFRAPHRLSVVPSEDGEREDASREEGERLLEIRQGAVEP